MRVGHTRPVGTTWRMTIRHWPDERQPSLGDLVFEDPEELHRGFLVVGVEETRVATTFVLLLERMEWEVWLSRLFDGGPSWAFVRDRLR